MQRLLLLAAIRHKRRHFVTRFHIQIKYHIQAKQTNKNPSKMSNKLILVALVALVAAVGALAGPDEFPLEQFKVRLETLFPHLFNGDYCDKCKEIAGKVEAMSPEQVEQYKHFFSYYATLSKVENPELFGKLIDRLVGELKEKSPEQFCAHIGFCVESA